VVSRRYISIAEAAEYLGISTKFVRNLIAEGELSGYRIGSYARHRTLRVDLDEIDDKLMRPVGPHWNDPTVRPRKRTNNRSVPDRLTAVARIDPLDQTYYRFCTCGHRAIGDHTQDGVGACRAPTWVNIPGELSRDTGPCQCTEFNEDIRRRRRKPKKHQS
jgi:excisionase family DNA binding protein